MKPVQQTKYSLFYSDGTRMTYGNCLVACVASILNEPIEEVPNIYTFYGLDENKENPEESAWFQVLNKWLNMKYDKSFKYNKLETPTHQPFVIMRGLSKRNRPHCVVYSNENGLLRPHFDPHPTREYLNSEMYYFTIEERITSSL